MHWNPILFTEKGHLLFIPPYRYRDQAAKDAESVYRHAQLILKDRGWPDDLINENDVKLFCKHAAELRLVRGTSLAAELDAKHLPGEIDISMDGCSSIFFLPLYG